MRKSLPQLKKQIAALQKQADELQRKESKDVIARIKEAIEFYDLTAEDLGFGAVSRKQASPVAPPPKAAAAAPGVKYRDESGNTWGGRGPRPQWLRDALANGKTPEDFLVNGGSAPKAASAGRKTARGGKKVATKVKYRDGAGNTWSGRGPRPRWFTEALAKGASLQDLAA